jgi:4-hydroxy-3-polyprenylbenzoate decarboxylase
VALGEGQLALTKCVILVDPEVNARQFPEVLKAIRRHFNPSHDFLLLSTTSQDTLDFTGRQDEFGQAR